MYVRKNNICILYNFQVFAGIRHMYSKGVTAQCRMPVWLPRQYRFRWWKANSPAPAAESYSTDKMDRPSLLKLSTPSISQRNGTICCYRYG